VTATIATRSIHDRLVRARAGIAYRKPCSLRHTFATLVLSQGQSVKYVAAQLGHTNAAMTLNHYARWLPAERIEAPGRLEGPARRRTFHDAHGARAVNTTTPRAAGNGTGAQERTMTLPHASPLDIAREAVAALFDVTVRPGEPVEIPGVYRCCSCPQEESFDCGEDACDCRMDQDQSEWRLKSWRSGVDSWPR